MSEEINKILNWIENSYTILNYKEELLLVNYIKQLQQENQQLKEKVEWYEKENKHNQEIIIKDTKVLDEIREFIKNENYKDENICVVDGIDILQILDKVGNNG